MKLSDAVLGVIGLCLIAVWGVVYMTVSFIFTGECFPND